MYQPGQPSSGYTLGIPMFQAGHTYVSGRAVIQFQAF